MCYYRIYEKAFIFLFPIKEYFNDGFDLNSVDIFNEAIKLRYIDKGYDIIFAQYLNAENYGIRFNPEKIVYANIPFIDPEIYGNSDYIYVDFKKMAKEIKELNYDEIIVGGFHSRDCVKKLAKEIYKHNKNTLIDRDMTEHFLDYLDKKENTYILAPDFDIQNYNPTKKLLKILISDPNMNKLLRKQITNGLKEPYYGVDFKKLKENLKCSISEVQNIK